MFENLSSTAYGDKSRFVVTKNGNSYTYTVVLFNDDNSKAYINGKNPFTIKRSEVIQNRLL